ncbi:MAG: TVP38/TMEM64 family protein [Xanthobacteraceae bacterium]
MATDPRPVPEAQRGARSPVRRLLPLGAVLLVSGVVIGTGLHRHLSFETLVRHHGVIHDFIVAHLVAAIAVYVAVYVTATALSIPGGLFLTLAGGMLLGGFVGGLATLVGATAGATLIFLLARSAFGEHLARRAGPLVEKLAKGFREDAFHYLLFLRLVPVFPFWLVNLVPALAGVPLGTFVAATAIGIVPATFAFAFVGAGLDSVIRAQGAAYHACLASGRSDCRVDFDLKTVTTPELVGALVALGVVALVPVVVKRLRARSAAAGSSR